MHPKYIQVCIDDSKLNGVLCRFGVILLSFESILGMF